MVSGYRIRTHRLAGGLFLRTLLTSFCPRTIGSSQRCIAAWNAAIRVDTFSKHLQASSTNGAAELIVATRSHTRPLGLSRRITPFDVILIDGDIFRKIKDEWIGGNQMNLLPFASRLIPCSRVDFSRSNWSIEKQVSQAKQVIVIIFYGF